MYKDWSRAVPREKATLPLMLVTSFMMSPGSPSLRAFLGLALECVSSEVKEGDHEPVGLLRSRITQDSLELL